jgi:DNA-binding CsgD family transcriptional regulator
VPQADPRRGLETARRANAFAERGDDPAARLAASLALVQTLVLGGQTAEAVSILDRCTPALDAADPLGAYHLLHGPSLTLIYFERFSEAEALITRVTEAARAASALTLLPLCLGSRAELEYRLGRWPAALAHGSEATRLAAETGAKTILPFALALTARVEAVQGRKQEARRHASEAVEASTEALSVATMFYAETALALLALSFRRFDEAAERLGRVAREEDVRGIGEPAILLWPPDHVEACARAGRRKEAEAALVRLERQAEHIDHPWRRAVAARCRGLLAGDEDFDAEFGEALRQHDRTPMPFERARTELCLGEHHRRAGRRVDARVPLRSALAAFEQLGAAPWAERAGAELRATGEAVRRRDAAGIEQLTAQELQVVLVVARGATNKEAAAELFLSPKTIDFHLRNVYRKLGVRSRAELARHFAHE